MKFCASKRKQGNHLVSVRERRLIVVLVVKRGEKNGVGIELPGEYKKRYVVALGAPTSKDESGNGGDDEGDGKSRLLSRLTPLVVARASASPVDQPSGVPTRVHPHSRILSHRAFHSTSGLPFSTLSFDTTAAPSLLSALSALSSLISSESTAITLFTTTHSHTGEHGAEANIITDGAKHGPDTSRPHWCQSPRASHQTTYHR
jgi:hypothetical protein